MVKYKHEEYRTFRNKLGNIIKAQKQLYYTKKFEKNVSNKRATLKLINNLRTKSAVPLPSSFRINGKEIDNSLMITNSFNKYFCSLAENLNKASTDDTMCHENPNLTTYLPKSNKKSIFFYDTTCTEITKIINDFKTSKASDIPIVVIKHCGSIISPVLASIINKCMINGKFPSILKTGKITPVYKKGAKDNIANYHPVSILPIFGKVFEKVLYNRIYEFCLQETILHEDQFGFQEGHSTTHALHESIDFIKHAHNRGKHILAIFIDLVRRSTP